MSTASESILEAFAARLGRRVTASRWNLGEYDVEGDPYSYSPSFIAHAVDAAEEFAAKGVEVTLVLRGGDAYAGYRREGKLEVRSLTVDGGRALFNVDGRYTRTLRSKAHRHTSGVTMRAVTAPLAIV